MAAKQPKPEVFISTFSGPGGGGVSTRPLGFQFLGPLFDLAPAGLLTTMFSNFRLLVHRGCGKISSGLYYKHVTIVNYTSSGVNKLKASLSDDPRVIIYDRHMLIVQASGVFGQTEVLS